MGKKVLVIASNYGLWAEELQAPWDALKNAGHDLTLATYNGVTPLPIKVSVDTEMIDPKQNYKVNPPEVVDRVTQILADGDWNDAIKTSDAKMEDYDALVIVGGPGAPLDITGNPFVHNLLLDAFRNDKLIGAICYAVGALVFSRDDKNDNKSIIHGKTITAHPHAWDFDFDFQYDLVNASESNPGTDIKTPGFVYPLQYITEDAVGAEGKVISDAMANREKPCIAYDKPFVTGLSVESSIAFGRKLVEVLASDN